jgi:hypothetical protein
MREQGDLLELHRRSYVYLAAGPCSIAVCATKNERFRAGDATFPSRMAGAWVGAGGLAAIGMVVAACNHEVRPLDGLGGHAGPRGPSDNNACIDGTDGCIDSCSQSAIVPPRPESAYCDATGAFSCKGGLVKLSSCPADACVRPSFGPAARNPLSDGTAQPVGGRALKT